MTSMTSRDFNHDVSKAKRAATSGPVIITDRGRPSHVLLSIEDYERLRGIDTDLVDLLAMDIDVDIDFSPARIEFEIPDL